jgi:hypothetical protein
MDFKEDFEELCSLVFDAKGFVRQFSKGGAQLKQRY